MKILVYGSLNIDLVFQVEHIVLPGETISSSAMTRGAGGKGENQAAALARAGMDVYMAGRIGCDGEFLLKLLHGYGVNTDNVITGKTPTGQALIQVDKTGQNCIVLYAGANHEIETNNIEKALSCFGKGDALLVQNEITRTAEIMTMAKKRGMAVYLNPSPFDEKIAALPLDLVDLLFVNEIEGAGLAGEKPEKASGGDFDTFNRRIIKKLCTRFPEVVLTAGANGAYYCTKNGDVKYCPAAKVKVVDSTGAGDTFTGFFIAARARGLSAEAALGAAGKAAGIACSRPGAMPAIPTADEVF
jgi:ribokinase